MCCGAHSGGFVMATETKPFDALEIINTPELQAEYIKAALEDGDPGVIAIVIGDLARAKGATQFAKDAGLSRETIYKTLKEGGNPTMDTLAKALKALGFRLTIEPLSQS